MTGKPMEAMVKVMGIRRASLVACLLTASLAWAGPQEDYIEGDKAYQTGDVVTAMRHLGKAADAGHAKAQALLGYILDKSEFNEEAVVYYRKSAEQGEPTGEYGLATMYAAGEGVKRDMNEARIWLVRSAEKGYYPAVQMLAGAYIKGDYAVDETNREQVAKWMKTAADNGYLPALDAVARAYRSGEFGIMPDAALAVEYETKAKTLRGIKMDARKANTK